MVALTSTASSSNVSCCLREEEKEEEVADWLGQNGGLHEHSDWAATLRK
jgi:hypothetical protein